MKKQIFLSVLFACVAMSAFAKIIRVNNNPGAATGVNCYTTLTAAVAAAVDDDVIYVEPSATPYSENGLDITKRLKIIGNGAYLSSHSGFQNNTNSSNIVMNTIFLSINFKSGSSGSVLYGLTLSNLVNIDVDNITIQRCVIKAKITVNASSGSLSNLTLLENELWSIDINNTSINMLTIKNNTILGTFTYPLRINSTSGAGTNGLIENNVIILSGAGFARPLTPVIINNVANASLLFINNIIGSNEITSCVSSGQTIIFNNNICSCSIIPSGSNNQSGVDLTTVFVNYFKDDTFSGTPAFNNDGDAQLKSGSPAINAGYYGNGDDIGAFNDGTNRPSFKLGLIPPYPTIYSLTVPATTTTGTLNVTLSTRSNN